MLCVCFHDPQIKKRNQYINAAILVVFWLFICFHFPQMKQINQYIDAAILDGFWLFIWRNLNIV